MTGIMSPSCLPWSRRKDMLWDVTKGCKTCEALMTWTDAWLLRARANIASPSSAERPSTSQTQLRGVGPKLSADTAIRSNQRAYSAGVHGQSTRLNGEGKGGGGGGVQSKECKHSPVCDLLGIIDGLATADRPHGVSLSCSEQHDPSAECPLKCLQCHSREVLPRCNCNIIIAQRICIVQQESYLSSQWFTLTAVWLANAGYSISKWTDQAQDPSTVDLIPARTERMQNLM